MIDLLYRLDLADLEDVMLICLPKQYSFKGINASTFGFIMQDDV